ncbi:MAG: hypothetical protein ACR2MT_07020 [Aurantibacter sp.]
MKISRILFIVLIVLAACKKKEAPKSPEAALLVFPNKNSECTGGNDISDTTREVDFRWQSANNTETYELRVTNINTNTTQTISTAALSARLPLQKGAPFSWVVISKNAQVPNNVSSATWLFYNAGSQTTYPPFPAEITAPTLGASIFKDINNEVTLEWSGSDVDNDLESFEIYFDTVTPPVTLLASPGAGSTEQKASVTTNTVYYWKVISKDAEGNTSDSGVFDFRVY